MKRTHANNNPKRQEILLKLSKCQECGKYDYSKMVQCDQCDKWSHYICAGVGDEIQNIDWSCPRCRNIPGICLGNTFHLQCNCATKVIESECSRNSRPI